MSLTVVAGTPATAAQYNALIPKFLLQGSDQTLNTTTFTNHSTFAAISIPANESWELCFNLVILSSTAASDLKIQWTSTGTVAFGYRHLQGMGVTATSSADTANVNLEARLSGDNVSYGVTASATVGASLQEKFIVGGGVSGGTITLQWGCVAASGNVTVKAGSHMMGHRYD